MKSEDIGAGIDGMDGRKLDLNLLLALDALLAELNVTRAARLDGLCQIEHDGHQARYYRR